MLSTLKNPPAKKRLALTAATAKKLLAVASTALLAVGLSVTGALPATAAVGTISAVASCQVTGGAQVVMTYSNPDSYGMYADGGFGEPTYAASWSNDVIHEGPMVGETWGLYYEGTPESDYDGGGFSIAAGTASKTYTIPDGANGGSIVFGFVVKSGAEQKSYIPRQEIVVNTNCPPAPTTEACAAITQGPIATNQNAQGWTFTNTRAKGHNEFTTTGLHVWTEGTSSADKAAGYKAVDLALKDVGEPVVNFVSNSGGVPSLQLVTDFNNDGTTDGILVGEPVYGADFWVPNTSETNDFVKANSPASTGSAGSKYHGTLDEWLELYPNARVLQIGYSLGSGVLGDAVIESIEVGCVSYGFSVAIIAAAPAISGTAKVGETLTAQPKATAWLPSTGVTFTYQWKANGTAISGATGSTYNVAAAELGKKISVTVTGSLAGYTSAAATSPTTSSVVNDRIVVSRLSGSDRYATAAEIAQEWDSASVVYIATGTGFADALSASSAAAYKDAPLLLTDPKSLSAATKAELLRLKPSKIIIVGGSGAVSNSVKSSLQALSFNPSVTRIGGADRYATSRLLAQATFPASTVTTAYVASGSDFPDALTATPAAANLGGPVVLIPGNASKVDAATVTLLKSLGVTSVKIAGGSGVVSSAILTNLKTNFSTVKRNSGSDRYATAVAINADEFSSASTVYLATGSGFADALAGAALAGSQNAPLFITPSNCVPQSVLTAITNLDNPKVVLLGGTGVLTSSVASLTVCS